MQRWIGVLALAALAGCGNPSNPVPPVGGGDGGGGGGDDMAGGGGCTLDVQCKAPTPRCDKNTGTCVACLPTPDTCAPGSHCVQQNGTWVCSAACRNSDDCPKTDGGAPLECCNGTCFDTAGDSSNCGACGKACPPVPNGAATCSAGACGGRCDPGFADCNQSLGDGCEVTPASDVKHCGGCGQACPPVANGAASCDQGACKITCTPGFADCDNDPKNGCESNLASDGKNCGACGQACAMVSHAQGACMAGACAIASCDAGYADCNKSYGDGCEANTLSDVANCGGCGAACPAQNAVAACAAGKCSIASCQPGFANCDGLPVNGCEVQIDGDVANCGACGRRCMAPNSAPSCMAGVCGLASCVAGFADCNQMAGDGCETRIGNDVNNCGACGKACAMVANGTPACVNATCAVGSCNFGFADCDMNFGNGCEANLLTPQTCGACNVQCAAPAHGAAACNAGMCGLGMCDPLWGNCDGNPGNGCERNLAADSANCGACNNVCVVANGSPACVSGACSIGQCGPGFADCDMKFGNGCEIATAVDPANCGGCGKACPPQQNSVAQCVNSTCALACNNGFGDCDKQVGTGCEVNLLTDPNNCNACGNACAPVANGMPGCTAGKCGVAACTIGFGDCDNNAVNGCERNLNTDVNHCGMCGKACVLANATANCANGTCAITQCNAGFADCDGNPANGCEVNLKSDAKNCNACGMACPGMNPVCLNGACAMCNSNVLVIGDNQLAANNNFVTALKNAGMNPTLQQDNYTYAGVPAAANYGAVVVLVGNQYSNDMPAAGQTSIVNAQAGGTGVVFVEWGAYHIQNARWNTLKNIALIVRTGGGTNKVTLTLTQANHAIWTGLPNSFLTFNQMGYNTGAGLSNGGAQIASCTECGGPGVAVRDNGNGGRIVQHAIAPDFNSAPAAGDLMWTNDVTTTKLMTNSVLWAARCL